jgi:ribosomal protein L11 methyltransferase
MREVALTVPKAAVEDVLDRLLPIVPGGVREMPDGGRVELRMRGNDLPSAQELARAAGRWSHTLRERTVSDDWRERRLADYEPDVIGGRLLVRPEWAPPLGAGLIDIALSETVAFGGGTHPTTVTCLELLLDLAPKGSFADLGCGTGVLAILAARLGWRPVTALDVQPGSVTAAAANARANGVEVEVRQADLLAEPAPAADGLAANVPAAVHSAIAASLARVPRVALVSGFVANEAQAVVDAYAARGLRESRRLERSEWVIALLE